MCLALFPVLLYFWKQIIVMTITIEVFDLHALNLLRELEQLNVIRFVAQPNNETDPNLPEHREFSAISLDTKGYKFNREEANER